MHVFHQTKGTKHWHLTTWTDLENVMANEAERYKRLNIIGFHLHAMSRIGNCTETGSRLMVARSWGRGGWGSAANEYGFSGRGGKNVLELGSSCWWFHSLRIFQNLLNLYTLIVQIVPLMVCELCRIKKWSPVFCLFYFDLPLSTCFLFLNCRGSYSREFPKGAGVGAPTITSIALTSQLLSVENSLVPVEISSKACWRAYMGAWYHLKWRTHATLFLALWMTPEVPMLNEQWHFSLQT